MNLFRTSFYSGISQAVNIITGLLAVKIIAGRIGPEGVALQGQYLNSISIISIFASGSITIGVIKYLAEYYNDKERQLRVIRTALAITIMCCLLTATVCILLAKPLAVQAFKDEEYTSVYWLFGLFLPLTALNGLFSATLNGLKKIPYLTLVNIIISIVNVISLLILSKYFGVYGVLIAANFVNLIVFIIHLVLLNKYKWFSIQSLQPIWDKEISIKLFKFSLMSLMAGFIVPLAQMFIRNKLIDSFGFNAAGQWQTVTRISEFYLSFVIAVLSVYYLPKLSELQEKSDIKREIYSTLKFVLPIVILIAFSIWFARDMIIRYLLTDKFLATRNLFHFQLIGDVFKIVGWMLSYILWAKAMTRKYLIIDGLSFFMYIIASIICINYFGLIGATIGFCVTYIIYFITMAIVNRKYLF
ncbi:MAG TPA: O-antigen translocase [Chitinophagaceae bacterium]|nr:O-antigen translocase [Chitinophagaceae bacterium]